LLIGQPDPDVRYEPRGALLANFMRARIILSTALYFAAFGWVATQQLAVADDGTIALRPLAEIHGLRIGTALSPAGMTDDPYLTSLTRHFSLVVPEYGMYMSELQAAPDRWDFAKADAVVGFAVSHGLKLRGHALIWGLPTASSNPFGGWTPTPRWLHEGALSRDDAIRIMRRHIETVMSCYQGRVNEWVVVTEALGPRNVDGMMLSPTVWLDRIGPDYIKLAFQHARKIDPDAVLILNDYGADYFGQDGGGGRVDTYYDLVVRLLEDGAPIDGIGFQFHLKAGRDTPRVDQIIDNMARYQGLGLSTHITELDARIQAPVTDAKLSQQAQLYETVTRAAIVNGAVKDIVLWGFTDRYSWITAGETFPDHPVGVIMDDNLRPWPSFHAMGEALRGPQ